VKLVSIADLSPDQKYPKSIANLVNSPRSLEACKRQGINLSELDPIDKASVEKKIKERDKTKQVPPDIVEVRFQHSEEKRK